MDSKVDGEFILLSDEQVFGSRRIKLIERLGANCPVSDFAILLGARGFSSYHVDGDSSLKGRVSSWYLSSSVEGEPYVVNFHASRICGFTRYRFDCVRPALLYSNISAISPNGVRGKSGFLEVEYGEYPQYVVDTELAKILDKEYNAGRLTKTGKEYTTDCIDVYECNRRFYPFQHKEYEYKGKKYVRVKYRAGTTPSCILSNGVTVNYGDYVWIEVSPIRWYVDEESKLLVSKTLLASGIRFCGKKKYKGNFKKTEVYMFLNKYFARDIIPSKIQTQEIAANVNPDESKIEHLIREIYSYLEGVPYDEKFVQRLDKIIKEYNNKLDKLKEQKEIGTPSIETVESITRDLELKLNMLLIDLKRYHEKYREYFSMLEVIDQYIKIINGKTENIISDLSNDLNTIINICLPFLNEEDSNSIKNELLTIFNNQKQEIMEYLHSFNSSKKLDYNTVAEMNLELRRKIHPILKKLSVVVDKREIEKEISESIINIINGLYEEPKNKFLSFFLNEINATYINIMNLLSKLPENLRKDYEKEINVIMNEKINYSKDFNLIINDLRNIWLSLNKILYKINRYLKEIDEIETGHIDLNKFKR